MTDLNKCLAMLKSPNASERYDACEELRVASESSPEVVLALEEATKDADPRVVERAILALAADVHQQMRLKMDAGTPLPQTPPVTQGKTFGIRVGAYLIDGVVLNVVGSAVIFGVLFLFRTVLALLAQAHILYSVVEPSRWLSYLFSILAGILYFVFFEWLYGATPGKLVLRMRVVQEDGAPCSFKAALVRGILRVVDGFLFGWVAYLNMHPPLQQRLGDKKAKTLVVDAGDPLITRKRPAWRFFLALGLAILLYAGLYLVFDGSSLRPVGDLYSKGAADANLLASDLGSEFYMDGDYNRGDFEDTTLLDASQRQFSSPDMFLDGLVIYLASFPNDTDAAMQSSLDRIAEDYVGDVPLEANANETLQMGDRGWAKVYHDQQSGYDLIVAIVLEKNALVRVILYGEPGITTLEKANALLGLILERIRTNYRIPPAAEPAG